MVAASQDEKSYMGLNQNRSWHHTSVNENWNKSQLIVQNDLSFILNFKTSFEIISGDNQQQS